VSGLGGVAKKVDLEQRNGILLGYAATAKEAGKSVKFDIDGDREGIAEE